MQKFNLNDNILVAITEYGWSQLQKNPNMLEYLIRREEIVEGKLYHRLQAHELITLFKNSLWIASHSPVEANILIP